MKNKFAYARNLTLNTVTSYIETALGLLAGVLVARALGPHDYGIYAFSVWLCGMVIYASNSSLTTSAVKFIAEARGTGSDETAAAIAYNFRRMQSIWSAICILVFCISMWIVMPKEWQGLGWLVPGLAAIAIWSRAGFRMLGIIGEGFERYEPENYAIILAAVVNIALIGLLVWMGGSFLHYFAVYAGVGLFMTLLVRRYLASHQVPLRQGAVPADFRMRIRRHVLITAVFAVLSLASGRMFEMALLKVHWSVVHVGYFAIASTLTKGAVELLASGLTAVLMPAMARYFGGGGNASLVRVFDESMRIYWFIGLLLTGLALVVTDGMVRILYGEQYVDAIPIILASLVVTGLTCFSGASSSALTVSDHQKDRVYIALASLVLNAAVAWALVPKFGLLGAGISIVVVRIFDTAAHHWCAVLRLGVRLQWVPFRRLGAAALVAAIIAVSMVVLVEWRFTFIPAAIMFVGLYLLCSLWFRAWRPDDVEFAVAMIGKLLPRQGRLHEWLEAYRHRYEARFSG